LASPPQGVKPRSDDLGAKAGQTIDVRGDSVVRKVSTDDGTKPLPLFGHRGVASPVEHLAHCFEFRPHPLLHGVPEKQEFTRPRLPANMRESKKVEGFRLPLPLGTPGRHSKPAEAYQSCLFGMHFQ